MLVGKVVGNIWATRKEEGLKGLKFLIVKPGLNDRENLGREPIIVVDRLGAGVGDMVMVTQGSTATVGGEKQVPVDARVIGIIDSVDLEAEP